MSDSDGPATPGDSIDPRVEGVTNSAQLPNAHTLGPSGGPRLDHVQPVPKPKGGGASEGAPPAEEAAPSDAERVEALEKMGQDLSIEELVKMASSMKIEGMPSPEDLTKMMSGLNVEGMPDMKELAKLTADLDLPGVPDMEELTKMGAQLQAMQAELAKMGDPAQMEAELKAMEEQLKAMEAQAMADLAELDGSPDGPPAP